MTALYSLKGKKIWVAGHNGMVGAAVKRMLEGRGFNCLCASRQELDLVNQQAVTDWLQVHKPDVIFFAAAKVGGIHANDTYPAQFLYENMMMEANVIHAAYENGVEKVVFLGSSCIYPRDADQPMTEDALLTGALEPTNEWYALAKISGIKLCQAYRKQYGCEYISLMPTNLYGPGDNFHPENSHVPAALLRRFHEAKIQGLGSVEIWGTGTPIREFLYVDDLADACIYFAENYNGESHVNVGTGKGVTIGEFAKMIAKTVGYEGELVFDTSRPDGMYKKILNTTFAENEGWQAKIQLKDGLHKYYLWYLDNIDHVRQA